MRLLKPLFYLSFIFILCCTGGKESNSKQSFSSESTPKLIDDKDKQIAEQLKKEDCVEVIRCLSAKAVADEAGMSEMWAIRNYKVSVWEKPSHLGKGKIVGEMRCGSRAIILDRTIDDYKVISPLDQSIGWVNKIQIERTSYQHPITRQECEKKEG